MAIRHREPAMSFTLTVVETVMLLKQRPIKITIIFLNHHGNHQRKTHEFYESSLILAVRVFLLFIILSAGCERIPIFDSTFSGLTSEIKNTQSVFLIQNPIFDFHRISLNTYPKSVTTIFTSSVY